VHITFASEMLNLNLVWTDLF